MKRVIGLGAGGHAKVVLEILQSLGEYEVIGLLDPKASLWGTSVLSARVLGDDRLLPELRQQGVQYAFIGLGSVGDTEPRRRLYDKAREHGFEIADAIHPQSVISPSAILGNGLTVMAGVVVNACVHLGVNGIINTGAIVDHDCVIGDHVHIATGAHLAGAIHVGEGTHIGLGASIIQGISIGKNVIVGAGAVVVKDIPDGVIAVGVPARVIKKRLSDD